VSASEQDLLTATRLIVRSRAALGASYRKNPTRRPEYLAADELPSETEYVEGAARVVLVNAYERNRRARERCLRHYGRNCTVCGFNFGARYGESAAGYIQVHHVVPIAKVGKEYRLNSISDLRPVCPNCHAVIHRREPPFSIEEVKQMLQNDGVQESAARVGVRARVRRSHRGLAANARKDTRA
jgi:predicted HNH restriction endonuclease